MNFHTQVSFRPISPFLVIQVLTEFFEMLFQSIHLCSCMFICYCLQYKCNLVQQKYSRPLPSHKHASWYFACRSITLIRPINIRCTGLMGSPMCSTAAFPLDGNDAYQIIPAYIFCFGITNLRYFFHPKQMSNSNNEQSGSTFRH